MRWPRENLDPPDRLSDEEIVEMACSSRVYVPSSGKFKRTGPKCDECGNEDASAMEPECDSCGCVTVTCRAVVGDPTDSERCGNVVGTLECKGCRGGDEYENDRDL